MQEANQVHSSPNNRTIVRTDPRQVLLRGGIRFGFKLLNKAAPDLASLAAERLFRSPRRHTRPAWEEEVLAGAARFSLPWGAEALPAWSWGDGPTVLLVHGWEGRGSQLGAFVRPLVELGFRVVTFDAPGHGDGPSRSATLVELARAVTIAMDEAGPVHAIVAHSLGSAATTYALSRAASVRRAGAPAPRLVFIAPPLSAVRYTQHFAKLLGIDEAVRRRMVARLEARYGVPLTDLDALSAAPRMNAPLFVVHDRDDREVSFEAGAALADRWPGARLMSTRGLGHRRVLRAPEVIAEVVEVVTGTPWPVRTGLETCELERELFERDRRRVV
ncbi:alpha/beta hydrolase [Sorangium sp. So ce367]|uniref:alpha/beta fold hydrolase n=1 Tax=Sorangium sp. So ce367 TaxID=3133305 RepID=UPI003F5D97DD